MKPFIIFTLLLLLAACSGKSSPIIISSSCSIDEPIVNTMLPMANSFNVSGWAFDKQAVTLPEHVRIQFTSSNRQVSKTFDAAIGIQRGDVAQALKSPIADLSGFSLVVPANSLTPGNYEIVVLQDYRSIILACGNAHTIQVK